MIQTIKRALKIWGQGFALSVASEMAYKTSFILMVIALVIGDTIGPLIGFIIYSVSSGIPGWSLFEFLLFQGILLFVFGFWHAFIGGIAWETSELVEEGTLEKVLMKPFYALVYISAVSVDFHGIAEMIVGLLLIVYVIIQMNLFSWLIIPFIFLILLSLMFIFSLTIIMASLSIIFVKADIFESIVWVLSEIAAYPVTIYSVGVRFFLTFIIPAAIATYWPASILVGKEPLSSLAIATVPVIVFFAFSMWLWYFALKKYQSAGG